MAIFNPKLQGPLKLVVEIAETDYLLTESVLKLKKMMECKELYDKDGFFKREIVQIIRLLVIAALKEE